MPTPQPNGHAEDPLSTHQHETPSGAAQELDQVSTSATEDGYTVPLEELAEYCNMPPEEAEAQLRHAYLVRERLWRAYSGKLRCFVRRAFRKGSGKKCGGKGGRAYSKGKSSFPPLHTPPGSPIP